MRLVTQLNIINLLFLCYVISLLFTLYYDNNHADFQFHCSYNKHVTCSANVSPHVTGSLMSLCVSRHIIKERVNSFSKKRLL